MTQRVFVPDCWTQILTNPTTISSLQVSARINTPVEVKVSPYGQPFFDEVGVEILPGGRLSAAEISAMLTTGTQSILYARALSPNGANVYMHPLADVRTPYGALTEPTYADVGTTNFLTRHNTTLTTVNANTKDVVLLGDSITEGWSFNAGSYWTEFSTLYPNIGNYGIGGNNIPALLWQIANGLMPRAASKVKVVTLMIGTNNNLTDDLSNARARAIMQVVRNIRTNMPWAEILVHSLLPRSGTVGNNKIIATNGFLRPMVNEVPGATYLDIFPLFVNGDNSMNTALFNEDVIHLNTAGYGVWWNALKEPLRLAYRRASL